MSRGNRIRIHSEYFYCGKYKDTDFTSKRMNELRIMDYKDSVFEVYIHESSCVSVSVHVLQKMQ